MDDETQNRSQYQSGLFLSGGYAGGGGVRVLRGVRFRRCMDGDAGGADVVRGDDVGGFGPDGLGVSGGKSQKSEVFNLYSN
ncbi:hypothetical protein L6452_10037 [Arctium lappa]|uniref:Uncharacterized protein n=1 Tax=Arctium lappa TaxID=4217 RepID=A0ACB9DMW2_ARCLA|nr:hypothetical protein L6452_10037 [Arctium lappa]